MVSGLEGPTVLRDAIEKYDVEPIIFMQIENYFDIKHNFYYYFIYDKT